MRQVLLSLFLFTPGFLLGAHSRSESAFTALTTLPIEEMDRLAKVAACEGSPAPERWHFLVYAPDAENGYREYVVENHKVVARRQVSQFAETIAAGDVMGTDAVKVDSDRLAALALQYARVNKAPLATCNYELSREGPGLAPRWKVDCLDREGRVLGSLVVNAAQERVVSHEGFRKEPSEAQLRSSRGPEATTARRTGSPANSRRQLTRNAPSDGRPIEPEPIAEAPDQIMAPAPAQTRRAEPVQRDVPNGPISRLVRGLFPR